MKMKIRYLALCIISVFLSAIEFSVTETIPCALRTTRYGSVCVCNETFCDYLENTIPADPSSFVVVSSSKKGLRFSTTIGNFGNFHPISVRDYFAGSHSVKETKINLDLVPKEEFFSVPIEKTSDHSKEIHSIRLDIRRENRFKKIVGFGGAFTGTVSHILENISPPLQDHIYRSFFSQDGIAYNMLRLTIGGSDFDLSPWAYNEYPQNDYQLTNFTVLDSRDKKKTKQIQRLKEVSNQTNLKLMAAAWSSPKWMKSNNEWTGFSHLKKQFYQTWANYHLRFLDLMDAENLTIWAISTGNEPLNGVIGWFFVHFMSLGWTPRNQTAWLTENLGPTIRNSKHRNVLIFGNDDQRYTFPIWFNAMEIFRKNSTQFLDGFAVHWYWDDVFSPSLIDKTLKLYPEKLLINTESCIGDKPSETHGPELGSWSRAEKYIRSYIQDLQHSFNGWIDWNIILDEHGGPNYVNNTVDAPIIVNMTNQQEFYKQPIFYAIGHFSKFITPDSLRVETSMSSRIIDAVAFRRPDGCVTVVIFNSGPQSTDVTLNDSVRGNILIRFPPRSVHTIVYK